MTGGVLIIGIGNEYRRDDGVGLAAAADIADRQLPGVRVITTTGDPASILDDWTGVPLTVAVDGAVGTGSTPGTIGRWTPGEEAEQAVVSSHALGLPQTYALGRAVDQLPQNLVVFTVAVEDVGHGVGLSPAVASAVPAVVRAVMAEVGHR
jgi:hydrogenase maturation protease